MVTGPVPVSAWPQFQEDLGATWWCYHYCQSAWGVGRVELGMDSGGLSLDGEWDQKWTPPPYPSLHVRLHGVSSRLISRVCASKIVDADLKRPIAEPASLHRKKGQRSSSPSSLQQLMQLLSDTAVAILALLLRQEPGSLGLGCPLEYISF